MKRLLVFGIISAVSVSACTVFQRTVPAQTGSQGQGNIVNVKIEVTYYPTPTHPASWKVQPVQPIATPAIGNQPQPQPQSAPTDVPPPPAPVEPAAAATAQSPVQPTEAVVVPVPAPVSDGSVEGLRQQMLALHNTARAQAGLPPLVINPQLQQAAQSHAEWLAQKPVQELWSLGTGGHIGAGGSGFVQRIATAGYPAQSQNVNENYGTFGSAQEAFDWWMNDPAGAPTHRPQILSSLYTEVGIGVVPHSSGMSTVFIINFGAR